MNSRTRLRLMASSVAVGSAMAVTAASADTELTFVWHAGTCADALVDIAKDYPDKSVKIVPALVPYGPQWHDKIASEFAIQGDAFDFAMWDSQSTAEFAAHAVKINDIFDKSSYLKADIFPPASLSRYGEYPDGSGEYYGLPANQDAYGLTYRKDLFEDPKEKEAFKAKYGIPIVLSYGATEFGGVVVQMEEEDALKWGDAKLGSTGRAYGEAQFRTTHT